MVYRPHVIFMNFTCPVFIPPSVNCQFYSPLEYYSAHFTEVLLSFYLLFWAIFCFPLDASPFLIRFSRSFSWNDVELYSFLDLPFNSPIDWFLFSQGYWRRFSFFFGHFLFVFNIDMTTTWRDLRALLLSKSFAFPSNLEELASDPDALVPPSILESCAHGISEFYRTRDHAASDALLRTQRFAELSDLLSRPSVSLEFPTSPTLPRCPVTPETPATSWMSSPKPTASPDGWLAGSQKALCGPGWPPYINSFNNFRGFWFWDFTISSALHGPVTSFILYDRGRTQAGLRQGRQNTCTSSLSSAPRVGF
jgi:hypothetical protein